ncbi:Lamin Tail Domain [Streptomyces sp. DvalAA-14]|uniref:lamin tail domain-containing protein n=1 Tax=unclassified Streptomyces TaxID=2593676 RepID=UPI00081B310A|nr:MULTISPECIES: lamin tail domain-containing protein [unclassified Streptomyces]MYS20303.1 lamin tail domain-containing protein [Streptomyces sp. SID4948]SCD65604.1 Lamin Tail Domain [Streptomyces sp. DvalAA-14]
MLRSRVIAAAAVTAAAAGIAVAPTPAGAATGSLHLYEIYYNSPGSDTGSVKSLDAEWVKITNSTSKPVSLTKWTLTDASRHVYTFGSFTLAAGRTVAVHTGKGTNTSTNRYQGRSWYVWNNDKDTATLRKSTGATVDTCSYNTTKFAYRWC